MKKASLIIALFFIVNFYNMAGWADNPIGPKIFFEETVFDAKKIDEGSTIEHTFKVRNTGDQPLEIKQVKPG